MRLTKTNKLSYWRETIFSTFAVLLFFIVYYLFSSNQTPSGIFPSLLIITKSFFIFFLAPFLFIKYILKENIKNYGFNLKNKRKGFIYAGLALVFSLILSYILIRYTAFLSFYKLDRAVMTNFWLFLLRELVFFNFALFCWEYFFQGFVMNVYSEKFLYGSIFIQAFFYLVLNVIAGENFFSFTSMIMPALIGGIIAYNCRSFFYSYFYSLAYVIILDSYAIYLSKNSL